MKLSYTYDPGAFANSIKGIEQPIEFAAVDALREATSIAETKGKANVEASGLGPRFVKSLKSRFYINNGLDAAGIVYSAINYSVVFERGAIVKGNPTLWIPLPTTPQKVGGKRLTAKVFGDTIGHLFKIKIGGREYLAAKIAVSKKNSTARIPSLSAAMLRNGARKAGKGQRTRLMPLFMGVQSTSIRKRLHIGQIVEQAADQIPKLYENALKED